MGKIFNVLRRDIKSGLRDWLIVYIFIAPFLIAMLLNALVPGATSSTLRVVLEKDSSLIDYMQEYAVVETVSSKEEMLERVQRIDDAIGIVSKNGIYEIIGEGNEMEGSIELIRSILNLRDYDYFDNLVSFRSIGFGMSPLKLEGGSLLLIFVTVFGGMLIVLNLVEEKMSNTLSAINVAPISKWGFVVGKAMLGFAIPVISSIGVVFIMGFSEVNIGMLVFTVLCSSLISVIIGFSVGVNNDEPIAAVASMKIVFVPVLASIFGGMYLSDKWQWILYWSPFYWTYKSINSLLSYTPQWSSILFNGSLVIVITLAVMLGLKNKISHGLK